MATPLHPGSIATNASIAAAPIVSTLGTMIGYVPVIVSTTVGLAALFYYWLVITKELRARKVEKQQLRESATRVVEKVHSEDTTV